MEGLEDAYKALQSGLAPKGAWIALRLAGDSMDRISPPESVIFVNLKDRRKISNVWYVMQTLKEMRSTSGSGWVRPDGNP